ncbi:RNA-directed DNA polymerase from mobile element jockey [Eumeta japonica]|uniref:RNA-directed DNA polymerase from mobile element jockey n=1 Tax=Eumeta variegata TaxID=151549 RepID=A0A4C1TL02_EUMVA|nr:RNA-directed DNA polymerase from mobile element jockey [Eumeta japonica]
MNPTKINSGNEVKLNLRGPLDGFLLARLGFWDKRRECQALLVAIFNACIKIVTFEAWKDAIIIGIPKPEKPRDLPTSYKPISLLSGLGKLFEKDLETRLCDYLLGNSLIINEQFGFRPNHSCSQQTLRLVEHISEDSNANVFNSRSSPTTPPYTCAVAIFNKLLPASRRPSSSLRVGFRPGESRYKYPGITLDKHLHFKRVRKNVQLYLSRLISMIGKKSEMSLRNKCTLFKVFMQPLMTYAAPVFAHADPNTLCYLQILQNNFCRRAFGAHWYVRNDILHRDLKLPTISKYMQDMSEEFFDIAANHPNLLLQSSMSYEAPIPLYPKATECSLRSAQRAHL